ncbi:NAD(P)-binding protein [Phyllosticta citrichinensis]|uniref:NAD(P)-binding protein n=1 Tax=Phyllosticta citrichinensis TaxID=1130410 RepID=A0ABR1Y6R7_9PEZI
MPYARVAAVTGANKGIGLAIVRNLALTYPSSPLNTGPLLIYVTARDKTRGEAALSSLLADPLLIRSNVLSASGGGPVDITYHPLDISDRSSIQRFASTLRSRHGDRGLDVLVNNAGVALDGFDERVVRATLAVNYEGTLDLTLSLLPLVKPAPTSRVVNVASTMGALERYSAPLQRRFRDAAEAGAREDTPATAAADTTVIMHAFEEGVRMSTHAALGFPSSAYMVSKAGVIGATRALGLALASQHRDAAPLVVSCCPGYVDTDMTKHNGTRTPDEGARTPVWLALADARELGGADAAQGRYFKDETLKEW